MSGHNKWSSIKHKKGANDAKRGRIFTKAIKEITIAARLGGGDPNGNPRLRTAIATARAASMPNDNITRAIKKGTGELEGVSIEEVVYEGYGPGGVALIIEVVTDNRNRTTAEVRHLLAKNNGNLGENGCVSWNFNKRGVLAVSKEGATEDAIVDVGLEVEGFEDVKDDDEEFTVYTSSTALYAVRDALETKGFKVGEAKLGFFPQTTVKLEGRKAEQMLKLLDVLDENDDIQNVYSNMEIEDAEMERIAGAS